MALGTITRVAVDPHGTVQPMSIGDVKVTVTNVVADSSYTTGGAAITPQQLGLSTAVTASICSIAASTGSNAAAISAVYTPGGNLVMFASAGTEVSASTNLSGLTVQIIAFGY